ncbi:hypothetical protein [Bradyrhizobium sp. CCBAU 51765]|uniref:hypothetical protein n=1 Tax=Bradyrhizobium sp. CCBAU 51765 TaxID=1325102 RepID=UPI0018894F23|nr:hypothetical protein [Bradyrhizobium sp. CCBAU 51765]QOZ06668.1 hypothetical protein XH96_03395 [Bradyrhizobium sp. CCBAU 51765]
MTALPSDDASGARVFADAIPERVRARPCPSLWSDDELLTLPEVVALFWPDGAPITLTTLRTAVKDGDLPIAKIAGKFFTTKAAIYRMTTPRPLAAADIVAAARAQPELEQSPPPVPQIDPVLERIRGRQERVKSKR